MANEKSTGANGAGIPSAEAIERLAKMGVEASNATIVKVDTRGLSEGLPAEVPLLFDRKQQKFMSACGLIEEFRLRPHSRVGTAEAHTAKSFIELVNRHKDEHSAVFADLDWTKPSFTAVIDYHKQAGEAHEPRNLGHRIVYAFPLSDEWQAWIASNGKTMNQGDFAAFIEDHIAEIASPTEDEQKRFGDLFRTTVADPHELMMLSRGLQLNVKSVVKQARTLQSGEAEVVFTEEHAPAGGGDKVTVPGMFIINIPVFFRGAFVRMPVRLRYRVKDGNIIWFYQVWRPDVYVTEQVQKDLDAVRVETGLPAYEGSPERKRPPGLGRDNYHDPEED